MKLQLEHLSKKVTPALLQRNLPAMSTQKQVLFCSMELISRRVCVGLQPYVQRFYIHIIVSCLGVLLLECNTPFANVHASKYACAHARTHKSWRLLSPEKNFFPAIAPQKWYFRILGIQWRKPSSIYSSVSEGAQLGIRLLPYIHVRYQQSGTFVSCSGTLASVLGREMEKWVTWFPVVCGLIGSSGQILMQENLVFGMDFYGGRQRLKFDFAGLILRTTLFCKVPFSLTAILSPPPPSICG